MKKIVFFILLLFFISGSFVAASNPTSASDLVEDSWNTKAPMNQARVCLGVVAVAGKIYAIGGATDDGYVGVNECYDPAIDTWVSMTSMPTPRGSFAVAVYQNRIYCIGGFVNYTIGDVGTVTYAACSITEVYDTVTDSWSTKASIPVSGSAQAHVVNGKVFVLLNGDMNTYGTLYMYDPVTDLWTQKTSLPKEPYNVGSFHMAHYMVTAATYDKILLTGLLGYTQEAMIYDPETDEWSQIANPPWSIFYDFATATTGVYAPQKIYLLGPTGNCVYDPVNDTWITLGDMPTPRRGFGVTVVDDLLYVIGGYSVYRGNEITSFSVNEQYIPFGYKGAVPAPEQSNTTVAPSTITPETSNPPPSSEPPDSSKPTALALYFILAVLTLTIGTAITSLFLYFRKKRNILTYSIE
jgi:N-acetylneuraminic acid mutarotase